MILAAFINQPHEGANFRDLSDMDAGNAQFSICSHQDAVFQAKDLSLL